MKGEDWPNVKTRKQECFFLATDSEYDAGSWLTPIHAASRVFTLDTNENTHLAVEVS